MARRDHAFPAPEAAPSLVVTARPLNRARNETLAAKGIAVVSVPDNRWGRVDIKTIGLLPNVLARQAAIERGARDAWFVDKRRQRHRRRFVQCLDRHARGQRW